MKTHSASIKHILKSSGYEVVKRQQASYSVWQVREQGKKDVLFENRRLGDLLKTAEKEFGL